MRTHQSILAALCLLALPAVGADAWPEVALPQSAKVESIANDMVFNGRSARLSRFDVSGSEQEIVDMFRTQFAAGQVIENRLMSERVLAVHLGDYFVTMKLHSSSGNNVQGTVMSTKLSGDRFGSEVASDMRLMLPAESRVITTLQSNDGNKRSVLMTGINFDSVPVNRDFVNHELRQRGFEMVQESAAASGRDAGITQQWASPSGEVQLTISNAGKYRSVIINRLTEVR